jgi:hypothetical protein
MYPFGYHDARHPVGYHEARRGSRPLLLGTALLLLLLPACGPPPPLKPAAGLATPEDLAERVAAFVGIEDDTLRYLAATDRRVALRGRIQVHDDDLRRITMGAVLAEDKTLAAVDGAIDPFSFEARARGLAAVKARVGFAPADLPTSATGALTAPSLEKELLVRLVDEEIVRLEEERALPRSASALVRGVVETWSPPASPQQVSERDRWLSRRLGEVLLSVEKPGALDVVRARELDDALDALERAIEAAGLGAATAELVKLREVLEAHATRPAAGAASDWSEVARGVRAHLGFALGPEALEARLVAAQKALRAAAESAIARAHLTGDALATHAAPLVFGSGACPVAVPGSRVRSMSPSPERAAACRLAHAMTAAADDGQRAHVLVAMHDHIVVALWALEVARGSATIAQASAKHRPLSRPGPDVLGRWERVALARPTAALGGGLAAEVLYGPGDPDTRARAWTELGDVPLDIAERELASTLRPARP